MDLLFPSTIQAPPYSSGKISGNLAALAGTNFPERYTLLTFKPNFYRSNRILGSSEQDIGI